MRVTVKFFSYFKDLAGCAELAEDLPEGATVQQLLERLRSRLPQLAEMKRSMLVAVGVEYQPGSYVLEEGDCVSLFPPVQGG